MRTSAFVSFETRPIFIQIHFVSSPNLRLNTIRKYILWYFNSRTGSDLAKAVEKQIEQLMFSS